jgi:hypothetical protein
MILHLWWLRLSPPGGWSQQSWGAALFLFYCILLALLIAARNHIRTRDLLSFSAVVLLFLNFQYDLSYLPSIQTSAKFNGITYYITDNSEFMGWGTQYQQFVAWKGLFEHEVHVLGYARPQFKLTYDGSNNVVNIVAAYDGRLVCSDGQTFRCYEGDVQIGSHRYYVSVECNRMAESWCAAFNYVIHECRPDNTSCAALPMIYTGDDGYVNLQVDQSSQDLEFYLEPYPYIDPGILIYIGGQHPQCLVDGCMIIEK